MANKEKQESAVNFAIIMASLLIYQKANPEILSVIFKSDNAGTYHSEQLIAALRGEMDSFGPMKLHRYLFSTSGDGKDK